MSNFHVQPVLMPQLNQQSMINFCKDELGIDLVRRLDESGIGMDTLNTMVYALSLVNKPPRTVIQQHDIHAALDMMHFGFLVIGDSFALADIATSPNVIVSTANIDRSTDLVVITASLRTWFNLTLAWCVDDVENIKRREFLSLILVQLRSAGVKDLWNNYEINQKQGYLSLRRING